MMKERRCGDRSSIDDMLLFLSKYLISDFYEQGSTKLFRATLKKQYEGKDVKIMKKKVNIRCPNCKAIKDVEIPEDIINQASQLTTLSNVSPHV